MKQPADQKEYFYVDESGDPTILGRRGRNLLSEGVVSRVFTVGYIETSEPRQLFEALQSLREEIADDQYLAGVPSMASTLRGFHANKDCAEVFPKPSPLSRGRTSLGSARSSTITWVDSTSIWSRSSSRTGCT